LMAASSLNSHGAARTKPRRASSFGPGNGPGSASGVVTWACAHAAGNPCLVPPVPTCCTTMAAWGMCRSSLAWGFAVSGARSETLGSITK
jgi:hypothetical protein